jgi:uncharacterized membrane protein
MEYLIAKWLHILSSTVLFGAGVGSAFHLFVSTLTRKPSAAAASTRNVVLADWLFTVPSAIFQPASGVWLLHLMGIPLATAWVLASFGLYAFAIACWVPVLWIQFRLRDLSAAAMREGTALPRDYWRLFFWWVGLGFAGFFAFVAIFWLMVAKRMPFA